MFFSKETIHNEHYDATKSKVEVRIDGTVICENSQKKNKNGPLHTCPWTPSLYDKGIRSLVVRVVEVSTQIYL